MANAAEFEFTAQAPPPQDDENLIYANGISATTGLPLCQLDVKIAAAMARDQAVSDEETNLAKAKSADSEDHLGTVADVEDPNDLGEAGWGIVFPAKADDAIDKALAPLLELREKEAGKLFQVFKGKDGYRPGESCEDWLDRHGASMDLVDPLDGVPFYLTLAGSPEEIPFEFQYQLDVYWGVGRLHFDEPDAYRRYAESVVAYENEKSPKQSRSAAIFATSHEKDRATQVFADHVAGPLSEGDKRGPLGAKQNFSLQKIIGESATKQSLSDLLRGKHEGGSPALLFSGSHGVGVEPDDPDIDSKQGALLCQDWAGWGGMKSDDWFAGSDLPSDAAIHGMIHFLYACYGGGCPEEDNFVFRKDRPHGRIAPRPLISRLPQDLLTHPNGGALAVFAHVDRAWPHSFTSPRATPQIQGFRDVLTRLLRGDRIGQATDKFDVRRAALSMQLLEMKSNLENLMTVNDEDLTEAWTARNDARNYIVLGDPAVRIRVNDL